MAEKRFSELTTAGAMTGAELLAMSQETLGTLLSVKSTLQNIANWFAVNSQYASALDTSNKTLCGAINELKQLVSLIPRFSIEVVQTLPTEDISETTIYLIQSSDPEQGNYYEEYIYVNNTWELVGTTAVDLSNYYTKLQIDTLLEAKVNTADIDSALSPTSTNPVQNKVITAALYARDDAYLLSQLDGTKATYDRIMREWFNVRGASGMTPAELTALCCEWYEKTVKEWDGSVTFDQPDYAGGSTGMYGTKGGDNAGLTCTPSTDTTHNTDDYEGLPLFACVDVNYIVDATSLDILITEIDGVTDGFVRDDVDVFVGVMQATGWHWQSETEETYTHGYRSSYLATYSDIVPLPEAVRVDGTVRPFVVHSKYMSTDNSGKLTSCSGVYVKAFESHDTIHTKSAATGAQYSGSTTADDYFLKLMTFIKYGSLSLDGIMNGCNNYNLQYYAQVAETGVKRIILPSNSALVAGSTVIVGTYNGTSKDRGTAANYNISGAYGWKILSIEDVTINETAYKAVYVDAPGEFNTTANGSAVSGTTIVSTWHWMCGTCDSVKGNDGSPGSNTDNLRPFRLQGVEYMVGGYEVKADVIMSLEAITSGGPSNYIPYTVARTLQQSTSITQNYAKLSDLAIECPASTGWQYIKKLKFKNGVAYPNIVGGSSTTYTKDAFYMNNNATTGTREWLAFGHLAGGTYAGLSCLLGNFGLTYAGWYCLPRLSPNGNRGEWSA